MAFSAVNRLTHSTCEYKISPIVPHRLRPSADVRTTSPSRPADVNVMLRKMASTASPTLEISEEGGTYQMKTSTTFKTTAISFRLGEPFDEETADGRKVKVSSGRGIAGTLLEGTHYFLF